MLSKKYIYPNKAVQKSTSWLVVLITLVQFLQNTCYAQLQQTQTGFKQISTLNGLSNRIANVVCEDENNFIWIGTDDGLNKLNGNRIVTYFKSNNGIYSNKISKLVKLKDNRIFVSTNSGCSIFNSKKDAFESIADTTNKLQLEFMPACFEINNALWIYGSTGIFKVNKNKVTNYMPYKFTKEQLITKGGSVDRYFDLILCNNRLFANMGRVLVELDTATMQAKNNFVIGFINHEGITQMVAQKENIWLSTWGNGLIKFNTATNAQTYFKVFNDINFSLAINNDELYIANQLGYTVFNTKSHLQQDVSISNEVRSIFFDSQNTLWLSTSTGVFYKESIAALIKHISLQDIIGNNNIDDKRLPVQLSATKNNLIFSLQYASGISLFDKKLNKTKYVKSLLPNSNNNRYQDIKSVYEDEENYWVGCNAGLMLCDKNFAIKAQYTPENVGYCFASPLVFNQIIQFSKHQILIVATTGILLFNTQEKRFVKVFAAKKDGTYNELKSYITDVSVKDTNTIFIATEKGVFELNPSSNILKPIHISSNNLRFNAIVHYKNCLYLASDGSFIQHDLVTLKTLEFTRENGLSSSLINALQLDTLHKGIWLATANGINFFNYNSHQIDIINSFDGLVDNNIEGCFSILNNTLYVGNINSITAINTSFISEKNSHKKVAINSVKVNGNIVCIDAAITVPNEFSTIEIDLGMPSLYLRSDAFFYYKTNNVWSKQCVDNKIALTNLKNGNYTIYFASKPNDEFITSKIVVNVLPAIYKKTWFVIISVLAIVGLFYFVVYYRIKRIKANIEAKNFLNNQLLSLKDAAFRAQMNPHFMFNTLNAINSFIIENKTEKASDYLVMFSKLMRKILENSKHKTITLEQEIESLKLYLELESARLEKGFDYTINIDKLVDVYGIDVPPLILQPYVENAIWHGLRNKMSAGNVWINIKLVNNSCLLLQIMDDGIGRQAAGKLKHKQSSHKSYGLDITQSRIMLMNAANKVVLFDRLIDDKVAGTIVEITLKL